MIGFGRFGMQPLNMLIMESSKGRMSSVQKPEVFSANEAALIIGYSNAILI
jgi:hypothetical protein